MKKYLLLIFIFFTISGAQAQTYRVLRDSALHLMWKAKDTSDYRTSFNLYEKTFKQFPQEVEAAGLYKAAVLAGILKEYDKAFNYLDQLLASNNERNSTWSSLTWVNADKEYENLLVDKRWPVVKARAQQLKDTFFEELHKKQDDFKATDPDVVAFNPDKDGKKLYEQIRSDHHFTAKKYRSYSIEFKVTDSLRTSYFVRLPDHYNPEKRYPVLFFLHGAVQSNALSDFQRADILEGWNRYYTKYAAANDVIMVYPQGSKQYNWMWPDNGFFMIPAILKEIKASINIDDDRVFISGHSNGATGSFSYLMKQQVPFAGFYGFNTQPKVRTGGTFIRNIQNRSYFNVSTDLDYYFPPDANDSLNVIMKNLKADYQDHRYNDWPHWFPQFDESEPAYKLLFADLINRKRNPFRKQLYWECDDLKYGRADWIEINQFDTLATPVKWHKNINFKILKLVNYDPDKDLVTTTDTLLKAFNFPRKSGAVRVSLKGNSFFVESSGVKSFTVFISPEMIDVRKPVSIYVNGIKKLERKAVYDRDFILSNYQSTLDRKAVWIDRFKVDL